MHFGMHLLSRSVFVKKIFLLFLLFTFCSHIIFGSNLDSIDTLGSFHVKSTNPPHLTHMDFVDILSSQYSHQEMKMLKILSSYHETFQNYDHLNYGPFSLDNKQYNLWHFETALIQPVLIVNIWNFEWGLIFWKYLLQKTFLVKILKITHVVEC